MSFGASSSKSSSHSESQQTASNFGDSVSGGSNSGFSRSSSSSRSSNPDDLKAFYSAFDSLTGGAASKQANKQELQYQKLSPDAVRKLGGLGATRMNAVEQAFDDSMKQIVADPSLTTAQRQRALQLNSQDYTSSIDSIAKETDGLLTQFAQAENQGAFNNQLQARASEQAAAKLLAEIFFGGKGQTNKSSSESSNAGSNFSVAHNEGESQGTSEGDSKSSSFSMQGGL